MYIHERIKWPLFTAKIARKRIGRSRHRLHIDLLETYVILQLSGDLC